MSVRSSRAVLLISTLLLLIARPAARGADEPDPDEKLLREAKVATDGPGLLVFLRSRALDEDGIAKVEALMRQLGDDSFEVREKASLALVEYGRLAVRFLQTGTRDRDAEIARRSRECLEKIAAGPGSELCLAALHLIARRQPPGAAASVLRYLPFADDPFVEEEAIATLAAVARAGGKTDPAVSQALTDKLPLKRAAAARSLGSAREAAVRAPVRKLLEDTAVRVRFEAAQALVRAGEKEAVATLIELLRDDSADIAGRAESLLFQIAADKPPEATAGDGSLDARLKWRDAWAAWWKANAAAIDLTKLAEAERKLGLVLVAETNQGQRVWEHGPDGKERWTLGGFNWPMDVRLLPGGNVLVADSSDDGVSERDKSGKIVWQRRGDALAAQRLPGGNTFICQHTRLVEVDRAGKEVAVHAPGGDTITDALRLPNGHVVFITVRGILKEITWPGGKEVRTLRLSDAPLNASDWYRIEEAAGGHFLLASHTDGRVFEIDAAGKVVWEHKVTQAYSATRLANGNVLIGTAESRRLIEVDRRHRVVSERDTQGFLGRVRAR